MALVTGTQALSTTPIQLPSQPCNHISIRNNDAAIAVLIGYNATTQLYTIPAGAQVDLVAGNLNRFWAKSASGTPTISYITQQ